MHRSTASILRTVFTATLFQCFVNGQQLIGSILHSGVEGDGMVLVTVENNGTRDYSVEARNNLFDTNSPYEPMNVSSLAGTQVQLVGAEYPYGLLTDASFVQLPAGAIWQRELNITAYMPADITITKPTASCYYVTFPDGFWAIDTTGMPSGENLATEFLTPGASRLVDLYIASNILHLNVTTVPGSGATLTATTAAIPQQPAATEIVGSQTIGIASSETIGTSIDQYDNILGGWYISSQWVAVLKVPVPKPEGSCTHKSLRHGRADSGGQNSLEHGGLALLRSTFLCEEQDVAVNDVHTPFVNLEIPDRTLGFKGWRIGVCVPRRQIWVTTIDLHLVERHIMEAILVSKVEIISLIKPQSMRSPRRFSGLTIVNHVQPGEQGAVCAHVSVPVSVVRSGVIPTSGTGHDWLLWSIPAKRCVHCQWMWIGYPGLRTREKARRWMRYSITRPSGKSAKGPNT